MSIPATIATSMLTGMNERGNILLSQGDAGINAWLRTEIPNLWLEITFRFENYPALSVTLTEVDDAKLAAHVNRQFGGTDWVVHKMNLPGVTVDNFRVVAQDADEESEEEDTEL